MNTKYQVIQTKRVTINQGCKHTSIRYLIQNAQTLSIISGEFMNVARVMKSLLQLKADKDLSFGERKLLDQAKSLFLKECDLATGKGELYFELQLEELFKS